MPITAVPLPALYHCGSGTHPGGGVTGAPGHNAARVDHFGSERLACSRLQAASIFCTSLTRSRRCTGFDSTLACLGACEIGVQRDGGKAGDEHDLDVGIELGGAAREFDAVHFRHHDIGEQQFERLFAQPLIGRKPVVVGHDVEAGILQRLDQKPPHVGIVFGEQDFRQIVTHALNRSLNPPGRPAGSFHVRG